ncbi:interferon-induced protein 44-like isoform X4 [Seriola lalandi dorsalis]|uniref:interferon-induced protein 44-like isoform X4 n=1 Tax=Seriola lalandi dorsalis TaxID=1841481 RepID=UPI000C6F9075|nr:interferon-induced protein 44-like isoform X4 [Seriola lalandi dorsalis]XP_056245987.1 interferon-induced protein 44-like isoform X2 [Seriola aureovittata]
MRDIYIKPDFTFLCIAAELLQEEDGGSSGGQAKQTDSGSAMEGNILGFNPLSPLSERDPGYNPTPSPDDRVHILVCVFSANSAEIKGSVLQKMKAIRETASDLAIPQMAIVTNIDAACAEIEKDLKNVYMSKHLKKKMTDFSSAVGIPMNCICPVKNYSQEIQINDEVDSLIVSALRLIIDFGDDFIDNMQTSPAGQ